METESSLVVLHLLNVFDRGHRSGINPAPIEDLLLRETITAQSIVTIPKLYPNAQDSHYVRLSFDEDIGLLRRRNYIFSEDENSEYVYLSGSGRKHLETTPIPEIGSRLLYKARVLAEKISPLQSQELVNMKLTQTELNELPDMPARDEVNPTIYMRFFSSTVPLVWYAANGSQRKNDFVFDGYVLGGGLTTLPLRRFFSLTDIRTLGGAQDPSFVKGTKWSEIRHKY